MTPEIKYGIEPDTAATSHRTATVMKPSFMDRFCCFRFLLKRSIIPARTKLTAWGITKNGIMSVSPNHIAQPMEGISAMAIMMRTMAMTFKISFEFIYLKIFCTLSMLSFFTKRMMLSPFLNS